MSGTNSTGATLARLAAEFVVIVVGVLVALFAESAWQERMERAEERDVLQRIADDLVADSLLLEMDRLWLDATSQSIARVPAILTGESQWAPGVQLVIMFHSALINSTPPRAETWTELVQAGRTDLISDVTLRRALTAYYTRQALRQELRASLPGDYRADIVGMLPSEYTDRVLRECTWDSSKDRPYPNPRGFAATLDCGVTPAEAVGPLLSRVRELPDLERRVRRLGYELTRFTSRRSLTAEDLAAVRALLPPSGVDRDALLLLIT